MVVDETTEFELEEWTPLDVRLGITKSLPPDAKLRWGICGTGRVCVDFVQALKSMPNARVTCVSARKAEKAAAFAQLHGIPKSYGSFAEMAAQGTFDIMYIGTLHPFHREHAEAALNAGKHVLVEKPVTCNLADAQALVDLAKEKNLFFSEGVWTRYFPAMERAKQHLDDNTLGDIHLVQADFGFDTADTKDDDNSDLYNKDLGGGCANYVSVYPISHVCFALGNTPTNISVAGTVNAKGVDVSSCVALTYPKQQLGVAVSCINAETPEETHINGKKGRLTVHAPAHCPTGYTLSLKQPGRGQYNTRRFEFELPEEAEAVKRSGGFFYPNSMGFQYEAAAVMRCVLAGVNETPQYPTEEMLAVHKIIDQLRAHLDANES